MGEHRLRGVAWLCSGLPSCASGLIAQKSWSSGPRGGAAASVRFLGEATDLAECDYVRNKANHEQPGTALHRQNQAPAENYSDYQVGDNSPKQFHSGILSEAVAPASSEQITQNGEPGVLAVPKICEIVKARVSPGGEMASGMQVCRGDCRVDNRAKVREQLLAD
jgi:hypothetical protein